MSLRTLDELNSRLCQESNDARGALRGELGIEVEVAMLRHLGAQPFALAPYPKHLENPSVCPICQSAFHASIGFYALPCRHEFHIVCLLKAL